MVNPAVWGKRNGLVLRNFLQNPKSISCAICNMYLSCRHLKSLKGSTNISNTNIPTGIQMNLSEYTIACHPPAQAHRAHRGANDNYNKGVTKAKFHSSPAQNKQKQYNLQFPPLTQFSWTQNALQRHITQYPNGCSLKNITVYYFAVVFLTFTAIIPISPLRCCCRFRWWADHWEVLNCSTGFSSSSFSCSWLCNTYSTSTY